MSTSSGLVHLPILGQLAKRFYPQPPAHDPTALGRMPSDLPKIIWVELTSKCPFDCVFCTRKRLYGNGKHMELDLYQRLIAQAEGVERVRLNHSGESIHYPHIAEAIRIAKRAGAVTELVSTLGSAPPAVVQEILEAGLDHLRVSVHAADEESYTKIYRFSSLAAMKANVGRFLEMRQSMGSAVMLDFHFVAMDRNLDQLPGVADYAASVGVQVLSILPVTQRDLVDHEFQSELDGHLMTTGFRQRLRESIERERERHQSLEIQVVNPDIEGNITLDETPRYFSGKLPPGGQIACCNESPWETTHILVNGDVMACGEHIQEPLGNLYEQSLREIWHGEKYRAFRHGYVMATNHECSTCPCKVAYVASDPTAAVDAATESVQFLRGWHDWEGTGARWTRQHAVLALARPAGSRFVHIEGMLPAAAPRNRLIIRCEGRTIGEVENRSGESLPFGQKFKLPRGASDPVQIHFETTTVVCPRQTGQSTDSRLLGFALMKAEVEA